MSIICANEFAHGNPFRYCSCGWKETPEPPPAAEPAAPTTVSKSLAITVDMLDASVDVVGLVFDHITRAERYVLDHLAASEDYQAAEDKPRLVITWVQPIEPRRAA